MNQQSADTFLKAIKVTGNDRISFLQGQFTQDLDRLTPQNPLLAGWTSAKGRLFCISWLADWQDAVWLAVPASLADTIVRRLGMYVLRANVRVELSELPVRPVVSKVTEDSFINDCSFDEKQLQLNVPGGGWRLAGQAVAVSVDEWRLANIRAGLPVIWPKTSEAFVPQMVNLDLLDAISFTKGCYVGQEIVARTQNLGRIKRRMFRFGCDAADISPGDPVTAGDTNAGTVVDAVAGELLAVIRLDQQSAELAIGNYPLRPAALPYSVPETS